MKVAVLLNGNYHPYLRRETLSENIQKIQRIFSECDIYYQTWDDPQDRHIFKDVDVDLNFVSKPDTVDYDPYLLAYESLPPECFNGIGRLKSKGEEAVKLRTLSCLQHLSLSKQYDSIPKGYDFYIRVRWDAYINDNFPLTDILELAKDNVVGIGVVPSHASIRNKSIKGNEYLQVRHSRKMLQDHVDRGFYCLIDETGADNDYNLCRWYGFLSDFMVIFKEEDMEGFDIEESYRNKELYGAEYGWHQILCRKRKHINIDGLVSIYRNIDKGYRTYLKLKENRLL